MRKIYVSTRTAQVVQEANMLMLQTVQLEITHLPTKIVVQCQNQRSQHKNKETCYKMLKARLYEHELQKREQEEQKKYDFKN